MIMVILKFSTHCYTKPCLIALEISASVLLASKDHILPLLSTKSRFDGYITLNFFKVFSPHFV